MYLPERFPVYVAPGPTGGPTFMTDVAEVRSGHEQRNENWSRSRHEFEASHGIRNERHFDLIGAISAVRVEIRNVASGVVQDTALVTLCKSASSRQTAPEAEPETTISQFTDHGENRGYFPNGLPSIVRPSHLSRTLAS